MNWILNSMEEGIAGSFKYCNTAKELWDSIEAAYAQKRNNARILELKKQIATFTKGMLSISDCYAKFRALWRELELYLSPEPCCVKKKAKLLEDIHVFELLGGVNPEYETVCSQVMQGEESRRKTRATSDVTVHDRSSLSSNIATNQTVHSGVGNGGGGGDGRGRGRGANRGGCKGGGHGHGGTDQDKLLCTCHNPESEAL